jgi:hypothetical protein
VENGVDHQKRQFFFSPSTALLLADDVFASDLDFFLFPNRPLLPISKLSA